MHIIFFPRTESNRTSLTKHPATDLDHSLTGPVPNRRIPIRPKRPLARGRILSLNLGHPTRKRRRRKGHLRNSRLAREDRLPGKRTRRNESLQLQDPGLGSRDPNCDSWRRRRSNG